MSQQSRDGGEDASPAGSAMSWARWLALACALGITLLIFVYRGQLARFAAYGYLGVFLISLIGNATVILPVPSLLGVFAGGSAFNPLVVGLVAGVAEPLGELTGYLAGYAGQGIVENQRFYARLTTWMANRHFLTGYLLIFLLSAIPNPFFDVAGISAGALRMPVAGFLISCWLGKTLKALVIAFAGARAGDFFQRLLISGV
jgi:membrane protein YqaA with SNARE-associated domain